MNSTRVFLNELERPSHSACVGCGLLPDLGAITPGRRFARFSCPLEGCQNSYGAWTASTELQQKWPDATRDKRSRSSLAYTSASVTTCRNPSCGFKGSDEHAIRP